MKSFMLMTFAVLVPGEAGAASLWQECQIETVTLCGPEGGRNVAPTLKLYFGDYADSKGRPKGYYGCRRGGACDVIEDPWVGQSDKYRAFVSPDRGLIARVGTDGKVTDVATLDNDVLISRGTCWRSKPQHVKPKARTRK